MPKKRIWDKTEQRAMVPVNPFHKMDGITGAQVVITYPHHEVHDGEMWSVSHFAEGIADDGTLILAFENLADCIAHLTMDGRAGGDASIELIEGPVISDKVAHPVYNMNRERGDANAFIWWIDPTLVGGTVIAEDGLPGGQKNQASSAVGGTRPGLEWITNPETTYAIRLTNLAGSAKMLSLGVNYYIEPAGVIDYD